MQLFCLEGQIPSKYVSTISFFFFSFIAIYANCTVFGIVLNSQVQARLSCMPNFLAIFTSKDGIFCLTNNGHHSSSSAYTYTGSFPSAPRSFCFLLPALVPERINEDTNVGGRMLMGTTAVVMSFTSSSSHHHIY